MSKFDKTPPVISVGPMIVHGAETFEAGGNVVSLSAYRSNKKASSLRLSPGRIAAIQALFEGVAEMRQQGDQRPDIRLAETESVDEGGLDVVLNNDETANIPDIALSDTRVRNAIDAYYAKDPGFGRVFDSLSDYEKSLFVRAFDKDETSPEAS